MSTIKPMDATARNHASASAEKEFEQAAIAAAQVFDRLRIVASLLRAAPASKDGARLLWRDENGQLVAFTLAGEVCIGRCENNHIRLLHREVSRIHCSVGATPRGDEVQDRNSSNGTFVNGERIHRRILCDGDLIQVGGYVLVYECPRLTTGV